MERFGVPTLTDITSGIREAAYGSRPEQGSMLMQLGLMGSDTELTDAGRRVEDAYFISEQPESVKSLITEAYRKLPIVQTLIQSLKGRPSVSISAAHHILVAHNFARADEISSSRALIELLNGVGIVVFSRKTQQLRIVKSPGDALDASPVVRVIEPERPFSNLLHLKKVIRDCKDYVYWADPQLGKKVLEILVDEIDGGVINEVRLLSGPAQITAKTGSEFARFEKEAANLGISAQWRIHVDNRDWHDRFVLGKTTTWNIPPLNSLLKGDYSEAWNTTARPPFESWWQKSVPLRDFISTLGNGS